MQMLKICQAEHPVIWPDWATISLSFKPVFLLSGLCKNGLTRMERASQGGLRGKESACNAGDAGSIPGWERFPGGGHGNPLQYSCRENGPRSPAGYRPWGHRESDMTEVTWHTFNVLREDNSIKPSLRALSSASMLIRGWRAQINRNQATSEVAPGLT